MVGETSESRFSRIKKLNVDIDNFSPENIVCVDDFEELTVIFKDDSNITKKLRLIRKK